MVDGPPLILSKITWLALFAHSIIGVPLSIVRNVLARTYSDSQRDRVGLSIASYLLPFLRAGLAGS